MSEITADPNRVAPGAMAHFQKMAGDDGLLRVGDEFLVRMPGPWDGPVRVVDVTATSFRFATLDGHLDAARRSGGGLDGGIDVQTRRVELEAGAP